MPDALDALTISRRIGPELVDLRRRLHRIPELGLHLPDTQAAVLEALAGLDLEVTLGESLSSVVAVLRGRAPVSGERPVVLLRGDMDALPVTEEVDVDYVSQRPGTDARVRARPAHGRPGRGGADPARAARRARRRRRADVPAGGGGTGRRRADDSRGAARGRGAAGGRGVRRARVLRGPPLRDVVRAAGHPDGRRRRGDGRRARPRWARGGARAHPDPVPVACEIVLAFQTAVTRQFSVWDPVVLTVGKIVAGTVNNVIPDDARIEASLRTFSPEHRAKAHEVVTRLAQGIAAAHGLTAEVSIGNGYPVTVNDADEQAFAQGVVVDLFGADRWTDMVNPEAGSEDMSFVLEEVPGAYLNVSACAHADLHDAQDNHSPRAAFDDAVVPDVAAALAEMALRRSRQLATG